MNTLHFEWNETTTLFFWLFWEAENFKHVYNLCASSSVRAEMYSDKNFLKLGIPVKMAAFRDLSCLLSLFHNVYLKVNV